jgi:hypothetical protein
MGAMSKSWVFVEVTEVGGEKKFTPLAGTEDQKCANRVLASMKLHKDETIKAGKPDVTLIHSAVVDDVDYNATLDDCLNPDQEDNVERLLSLVNME